MIKTDFLTFISVRERGRYLTQCPSNEHRVNWQTLTRQRRLLSDTETSKAFTTRCEAC